MPNLQKILIVDDEPRICDSLKCLLGEKFYEIETVQNGREAKAAVLSHRFDLVLLDILLPDISGLQVQEYIFQKSPGTMVVIMTGYATVESAVEALKGGAFDYLRKPFVHEELLKTVRNALEQKKLRDKYNAAKEKLNHSEKKYGFLVQNSPDLIYTLDPEGKFSFTNNTFEKLLGYSSGGLTGKHYTYIIHEEDLGKAKYFFNERRIGERATVGREIRLKCNQNNNESKTSGSGTVIIELESQGIYEKSVSEKGKMFFLGTYGVARDITYRKQLESQLRYAQKMKTVGMLAGGIAHDFNNILMGIQGYTSLMLMETNPGHSNYEKLEIIEEQVDSASQLIQQLLGFAKDGKFDVRPIDLNEVIKKISTIFVHTRKEIFIRRDFQMDIWAIEADQSQIEQVLLNLFVNAWQAMPLGGEIRVITKNVILDYDTSKLLAMKPGNYAEVSVVDTGVGMDEETKEMIFDPFFTTKEKGKGTGLGLASVYGIVKNHKGSIQVSGKKGEGTTFKIYFPALLKKSSVKVTPDVKHFRGTETILLVDDEDILRNVGKKTLSFLGYKVFLAGNGKEAIEIYKVHKNDIDLVMLDIIMPVMGGGEVYTILKKINQDIKVLLSSGYSFHGQAAELLRRGCRGFIQKPFTLGNISEKLREVLDS